MLNKHEGGAPFIAKISDFGLANNIIDFCGAHTSQHVIDRIEAVAMEVIRQHMGFFLGGNTPTTFPIF